MNERARIGMEKGTRRGRRTTPRRRPAGALAAAVCGMISLSGIAAATMMMLAHRLSPDIAWLSTRLERLGATPALTGATAALFLGLALVLATKRRENVRVAGAGERAAQRPEAPIADHPLARPGRVERADQQGQAVDHVTIGPWDY